MEHLKLKKMNPDGYDFVTFDNDVNEYPHAQGYQNFKAQLLPFFPEEEKTLDEYCRKIQYTCDSFPLYNLKFGDGYQQEILSINAKNYFDELTENKKLRSVLAGTNFLYGGNAQKNTSLCACTIGKFIYSKCLAVFKWRKPNNKTTYKSHSKVWGRSL